MGRSHIDTYSARQLVMRSKPLRVSAALAMSAIGLALLFWRVTSKPSDVTERTRTESTVKTPWSRLIPLPPPAAESSAFPGDAREDYLAAMSDYRKADYVKASIGLRRATQAAPQDAELRMYLGSCLLMTRDYGAAAQELKTASLLAAGSRRDLALILLARAQLDRGDVSTARETLTQVAMNTSSWSATARTLLDDFTSEP